MKTTLYTYRCFGDRYVVSVANHAELSEAIMSFCTATGIAAGSITGIGAVNEATLRFFDPATKQYVDKTFAEQMEVANLTGNVSQMNGRPYIHLHCVLGRADYSALAGHLLTAHINGACEIEVSALDGSVGRRYDEETGLNMYDF